MNKKADPFEVDPVYSIKLGMVKRLGNVLYTACTRQPAFYGSKVIRTWDYQPTAGPRAAKLLVRVGHDGARLYNILTSSKSGMLRGLFVAFSEWNPEPTIDWDGDSLVIEAEFPPALQMSIVNLDRPGDAASLRAKDGATALLGLTDDWHYASMIYSGMDAHALYVGKTGSGKTTTMETVITQLARSDKARLVIIDGAGTGNQTLERMSTVHGLVGPIAYTEEDALSVMRVVSQEMEMRNRDSERCQIPYHVIVDEFHVYTRIPEFSRWADDFGRRARKRNMHLSFGTQRTETSVWGVAGATLQGQFGNLLLHKMLTHNDVMTVTGSSYPPAHMLAGPGDCYHVSNHYGVQRIQVAQPTERDIAAVTGNDPGTAWDTHPGPDLRFSTRQHMAALHVAWIRDQDNRRGGRGTLQDLLERIGEPEKSNQNADDLLEIGRLALAEFQERSDNV